MLSNNEKNNSTIRRHMKKASTEFAKMSLDADMGQLTTFHNLKAADFILFQNPSQV